MTSKKVAYLGPPGTFTEQAAVFHNKSATLEPYPTIQSVALAVATSITEEGVVPIENSLEGSVTATLDILIQEPRLFICREIVIPIEHSLVTKPETNPKDIRTIFSHPQAIGQCRNFLEYFYPTVSLQASLSTVSAVDDMENSGISAAAISPSRIGEIRKVVVISEGIQDNPYNVTRFAVLSSSDHCPTGNDKTSICFSFPGDSPGLLYQIMGEFAQRNINLAKVESRPTKQSLGEYIFLIDCEGHRQDSSLSKAMEATAAHTSMFRILGSYPKWAS